MTTPQRPGRPPIGLKRARGIHGDPQQHQVVLSPGVTVISLGEVGVEAEFDFSSRFRGNTRIREAELLVASLTALRKLDWLRVVRD
ncbi:MAG: hypothetical protein WB778_07160 [Thermoplasmata archaeon]